MQKKEVVRPKRRTQTEISAGGIVFKRTLSGVRVALIMDPYGKWAFAKGHVEKDETIEHAALRETREEMGLRDVRIIAPLGKIDFWFRDRYRPETKGVMVHKFVHYFLMQTPIGAHGTPQKKERIHKIIWVGLGRVQTMSSYSDVAPVLDHMQAWFRKDRIQKPSA